VTTRSDPGLTTSSEQFESPHQASPPDEIIGILDTIDVPVVVVGRDCTVTRFNRAASDTLALAPSDVGRRLSAIDAFTVIDDVEALCTRVIDDSAPCRRDVRVGDRCFVLRLTAYAKRPDRVAGAVLTFTNVTAFRASLDQAIREREYTKAILNAVTSPLVVLDLDLRVQAGNRAFYSVFGVSRENAHGVCLKNLAGGGWKNAGVWTSLLDVLSEDTAFQSLEVEGDFPGLGRRTVVLDASRVSLEGQPAVLVAVQDVTERKRAEAALQDADRRKDEFLALLSHELRNPLAPIRTGLELIGIAGDTPESVRRVRTTMQRQVSQMARLIDDLLDVSRIASGKIVLQRTPTSLNSLIRSAVESQRAAIEAADLDLDVCLPPQDCLVNVDPTRFVQVLSNVLHNACKFTPSPGKIRCGVETVIRNGPEAVITISDTGIGIDAPMLPRVFELFTQAESATERAHGGLGIGLALARRLIEMHDGQIAAKSDGLACGSTFTITMPISNASTVVELVNAVDIPRLACRVVVIDDNRDAAEMTLMLLEQLGASARMAHDATSGLDAVREFTPNIVLLDIGLPGADGYDVCRRIRAELGLKDVVIIAVTGWGQAQDKQRADDAGFNLHLTKPVDPMVLARVLAERTATQA
jgi:two-component system, chemotaxis family, CheB/CheR fusion protein